MMNEGNGPRTQEQKEEESEKLNRFQLTTWCRDWGITSSPPMANPRNDRGLYHLLFNPKNVLNLLVVSLRAHKVGETNPDTSQPIQSVSFQAPESLPSPGSNIRTVKQ